MNYVKPIIENWSGRIDSQTNYDAYRWHQWISPLDLEDHLILQTLDLSKLNIGFIGFCCDEGIRLNKGREGAAWGPRNIRKELSNLPCSFTQDVKLYDCGNIEVFDSELDEIQSALAEKIDIMIKSHIFPIVLGGGHELAFGHYNGLRKTYDTLGIINLDAHFDLRPYGATGSSGTMFRQIADQCTLNHEPFNYMCLGLQKRGNTIELFKTAKALGVEYLLAKEISSSNISDVYDKIDKFARKNKNVYLTLCTDVISSAYAPGVSSAQPLGMHPELVLNIIKHVIKTDKIVAFDVAEVSPSFDQDNVTANLASTFIFALVNELAALRGFMIEY